MLLRSNDHDLTTVISDGISFIGSYSKDSFAHSCIIREGNSSTAVLTHISNILGPAATSQRYSNEIKTQLKQAEQWGSCHTEHDGGYANAGYYQRLLDPSRGVNLLMYRGSTNEKYLIKYVVVDVDL